jgi:type VI protein secretion system component Hcp
MAKRKNITVDMYLISGYGSKFLNLTLTTVIVIIFRLPVDTVNQPIAIKITQNFVKIRQDIKALLH